MNQDAGIFIFIIIMFVLVWIGISIFDKYFPGNGYNPPDAGGGGHWSSFD